METNTCNFTMNIMSAMSHYLDVMFLNFKNHKHVYDHYSNKTQESEPIYCFDFVFSF
jgi:hypothetical protein